MTLDTIPIPLVPGQRVTVFLEDSPADATIGYQGTVVRLRRSSRVLAPHSPDSWVYVVYFSYFDRCYEVVGSCLLALDTVQLRIGEFGFRLHFEATDAADATQIEGWYWVPSQDWTPFVFRKHERLQPSFKFRLPIREGRIRRGIFIYRVPTAHQLNRAYVEQVFSELHDLL